MLKKWRKTFHTVSTVNMLRSLVTAKAAGGLASSIIAEAKSEGSPGKPVAARSGRVSMTIAMAKTVDHDVRDAPLARCFRVVVWPLFGLTLRTMPYASHRR